MKPDLAPLAYAAQVGADLPLDHWISYAVKVLRDAGIETYESCQGGPGHAGAEPFVRFHGERGEGFRAFAAARAYGLPVLDIRRFWAVNDGEPCGPHWELTFRPVELRRVQRAAERERLIT